MTFQAANGRRKTRRGRARQTVLLQLGGSASSASGSVIFFADALFTSALSRPPPQSLTRNTRALSRAVDMALACLGVPVAASRVRNAPPSTRGSARPAPVPRIDASRNARDSVSRRGATTTVRATKQSYASFDDMIEKSPVPVLVDFYATWCGPCQLLSKQVFPQVAAAVGKDKVSLVKIDTEKYPNIASKFKVEALPTIILFKNGQVADRIEGLPDATQLTERLKYMLGAS